MMKFLPYLWFLRELEDTHVETVLYVPPQPNHRVNSRSYAACAIWKKCAPRPSSSSIQLGARIFSL